MPHPAPFKLPRVAWSKHGANLLSFRRDAIGILGEYLPGEGAMVIDPLWTGARFPEVIAKHEEQHQSLTINTAFGLFTQLLFLMAARGFALDVLRECMEKQWCVQELAATYTEMAMIATFHPEALKDEIRKLPSARLDQPPYREVFDAMDKVLGVDPRKSKEVLSAQAVLVVLLVSAALNSDCLQRMASGPISEDALLACMEDSPSLRFEQIVKQLIKSNSLNQLLLENIEQLARPEGSYSLEDAPGAIIFQRIVELVPEIAVQTHADVVRAAAQVEVAWGGVIEKMSGQPFKFTRLQELSPPPKIMESREREKAILASNPPRELPSATFHERLTQTVRQSLGLTLELAVKESEALVTARSYYLKPGAAPQPADEGEYPVDPLPLELSGLKRPKDILKELDAFPTLPHVVIFIEESWQDWYRLPGGRERSKGCIRICRQTHLSRDAILNNIMSFEELGRAAQAFLFKFRPERYVACFFNQRQPQVYALQKVAGDFGLDLFFKICKGLNVEICAEPRKFCPHVELLNMVSFDFHF